MLRLWAVNICQQVRLNKYLIPTLLNLNPLSPRQYVEYYCHIRPYHESTSIYSFI